MKVSELLEAAFALLDEYDYDRELDATPPALFFSGGRERLMALINLASAELWGVNNRIRMAFGLPGVEYTSNARKAAPTSRLKRCSGRRWRYTAASAVIGSAEALRPPAGYGKHRRGRRKPAAGRKGGVVAPVVLDEMM